MADRHVVLDLTGSSGPVSVALRGMPVRVDLSSGGYRYAYPDFGADLIEAVFGELPLAHRGGLPWKRTWRCGECDAELRPTEGPSPFPMHLDLRRTPAFDIEFVMPGRQCEQCGSPQVMLDRQMGFHVSEALRLALDAGHVEPG